MAVNAVALPQRSNPDLPSRLQLSRLATGPGTGALGRTDELVAWIDRRRAEHGCRVDRIPFADLDGWSFDPATGDLGHHTGRFFTVAGVDVRIGGESPLAWQQPIIVQPEVGILGLLAKEFGGVLHFLVQAKVEPGNPGLVQVSPTVQATRSNYTRVHRGAAVRHLDHFLEPYRGEVVADALQSEHGSWFLDKANRNVIVETVEDVDQCDDFRWATLGQLGELMRHPNLVNMDTRTVLAGVPVEDTADGQAVHTDVALLSWIAGERARSERAVRRIALGSTTDWTRGPQEIGHACGEYFRVVAVGVDAPGREVRSWTQPLFEPVGRGLVAFVVRRVRGVPHLLVRARPEAGHGTVELGPTVQCVPRGDTAATPFLDLVRDSAADRLRYDTVQSEEGGRFLQAETRYMIVEATAAECGFLPPGFRWLTPGQLADLVRHGRYLNVQARTLLAALTTGAAAL